jgi:hypothetical protein
LQKQQGRNPYVIAYIMNLAVCADIVVTYEITQCKTLLQKIYLYNLGNVL